MGGGDVKGVFECLARGIKAVGDSVKAESGKDFLLSPKFGYIHSCPTNLGTGMRASVHVYFPHTSLLLQNPYLKIAKKNRKCHLSDFLMSLKMFKKSSKNSKIIFFTTYFSSSYPMLNMSMHV